MSQIGAFGQISDRKQLVERYRRLHETQLALNQKLVLCLDRDILFEGGKRLGLLHEGTLVFDNEDQTSVLMDYCIYNVSRRGDNVVDQYLKECPPDDDSDEMTCLKAMQHATYTLLRVLEVERGVGCVVRDLFSDEVRLLIDLGLGATAVRGLLIATRVLDHGKYITTGGAGLPFGVLEDDQLDHFERVLRQSISDPHFDPAPLIRQALAGPEQVAYEDSGAIAARSTPTERSRELRTHLARKSAANKRCSCGSGKMFKNCCGKP